MQLFMAVPMTPLAAVADFGGQRYRWFIPFNFLLSLAAPHLHSVLVLVTGNKFITGVVVNRDNCSPVSSSPAINLSPVTTTPVMNLSLVSTTTAITENPWQGLIFCIKSEYYEVMKLSELEEYLSADNWFCEENEQVISFARNI
jgi:hypothetical protein